MVGAMMADDAARDFLELQLNYLMTHDGSQFLRELPRFAAALQSQPILGEVLDTMRREHRAIEVRTEATERAFVKALVAVKAEIVRLDPASQIRNESPRNGDRSDPEWRVSSFAAFDAIAAGESLPLHVNDETTRPDQLCRILRGNLERLRQPPDAEFGGPGPENLRPELVPATQRFVEIERQVADAKRDSAIEQATHPALALGTIDGLLAELETLRAGKNLLLDPLDDANEEVYRPTVARAKTALKRLRHDLTVRLASRRSLVALLERFRARCQWHARAELYALANRRGGKPEDRLVAELARWLHDQGLNPIGQASAGGLRPDLFDPSRRPAIYIEAKQYKTAPFAKIRQGIKQVEDTAAQFTADPYRIDEAFLVVFRLDGGLATPHLLTIPRGTYRLHVVIVDLKPITKVGSRQRAPPVSLTVDSLLAP